MGCNCQQKKAAHKVIRADGTIKRYATAAEAKAAASVQAGAKYVEVQQN